MIALANDRTRASNIQIFGDNIRLATCATCLHCALVTTFAFVVVAVVVAEQEALRPQFIMSCLLIVGYRELATIGHNQVYQLE